MNAKTLKRSTLKIDDAMCRALRVEHFGNERVKGHLDRNMRCLLRVKGTNEEVAEGRPSPPTCSLNCIIATELPGNCSSLTTIRRLAVNLSAKPDIFQVAPTLHYKIDKICPNSFHFINYRRVEMEYNSCQRMLGQ